MKLLFPAMRRCHAPQKVGIPKDGQKQARNGAMLRKLSDQNLLGAWGQVTCC